MMMVDYNSQYAPSTFSSDTISESMMSRTPRMRTVRLIRPSHGSLPPPGFTCRHGPTLGFSIRGGREHGTGFFVSQVENGSEANRQGLKVGDQIIRVNGFAIEDAVHKEVVQLISNHTHLTMKVRTVGMLPIKDKKTDPLSWQIISDNNSSTRSSPQLTEKIHDVRINIMVAPRTKLGCGICKGPEWKPGIFIQFTKEAGIAREAGLRPGDQILYCNNVDFTDISFNEAVNIMKNARQLDLLVRKSAGSELFPGESSGYNSSASSVTGDQSPSWSESKRLSIVKEEINLDERLDRFKNNKKWEKIEWDDEIREEKNAISNYNFKPTIINLTDNGTTIKNNGEEDDHDNTLKRSSGNKIADICLVSRQHELKTVVVEVHRSDEKEKIPLVKSPSICSFNSVASKCSDVSSSLSSAICEEIQRRARRIKPVPEKPSIDDQLQIKKILKGVNSDKQQQHSQLMDEFKKAHKKMFKSICEEKPDINEETITNRNVKDYSNGVTEQLPIQNQSETVQKKSLTSLDKPSNGNFAPPPPPLPIYDESTDKLIEPTKQRPKPPPPPVPQKTSSQLPQPPPCPTPDYDNLSLNSTLPRKVNFPKKDFCQNGINDAVEMESLESFKLHESNNETNRKPPNTYFNKTRLSGQLSNGSATSTLTKKPVNVTIGGYSSGTTKKQIKKLDFLNGSGSDTIDRASGQSISSQLASELALTLNRSNLKKRTESMENLLNHPQIKAETNGSVRISVNSPLSKQLAKSTNDLSNLGNSETYNKPYSNRVTILCIPSDKKHDAPNGILKHGQHRSLVQQKSITFGPTPTVINEQQLHVT
ncbi:harmonin isoform X1 [Onthophagus taurus]|uniref:harmonin isoform X1 n=1 Tax=Onthophagus taurus TaxID=166361 RepID=UPI0039BE2F0D